MDNRHLHEVRIAESDLDALRWAWRADKVKSVNVPDFEEWLSGLLWEQASAIRAGLGAHTGWQAVREAQKRQREQEQRSQGVHFHLFPERK